MPPSEAPVKLTGSLEIADNVFKAQKEYIDNRINIDPKIFQFLEERPDETIPAPGKEDVIEYARASVKARQAEAQRDAWFSTRILPKIRSDATVSEPDYDAIEASVLREANLRYPDKFPDYYERHINSQPSKQNMKRAFLQYVPGFNNIPTRYQPPATDQRDVMQNMYPSTGMPGYAPSITPGAMPPGTYDPSKVYSQPPHYIGKPGTDLLAQQENNAQFINNFVEARKDRLNKQAEAMVKRQDELRKTEPAMMKALWKRNDDLSTAATEAQKAKEAAAKRVDETQAALTKQNNDEYTSAINAAKLVNPDAAQYMQMRLQSNIQAADLADKARAEERANQGLKIDQTNSEINVYRAEQEAVDRAMQAKYRESTDQRAEKELPGIMAEREARANYERTNSSYGLGKEQRAENQELRDQQAFALQQQQRKAQIANINNSIWHRSTPLEKAGMMFGGAAEVAGTTRQAATNWFGNFFANNPSATPQQAESFINDEIDARKLGPIDETWYSRFLTAHPDATEQQATMSLQAHLKMLKYGAL
jgi:hypothetical protein